MKFAKSHTSNLVLRRKPNVLARSRLRFTNPRRTHVLTPLTRGEIRMRRWARKKKERRRERGSRGGHGVLVDRSSLGERKERRKEENR